MNDPRLPYPARHLADLETIALGLAHDDKGHTTGRYLDLTLHSHFQPIVSLAHGRAVGFEALLRGRDAAGEPISPVEILSRPRTFEERLFLDRLSRAVHVDNFLMLDRPNEWLFLNMDPEVFVRGMRSGSFFRDLFCSRRLPFERVVVEVLERAVDDEQVLNDAVGFYRDCGCLIALDDFGAGHSNFNRVWALRPDIVKLDRQIIARATREIRIRRMLPGIVSLLHEAGALVIVEGVETEEEAILCMDADADFVQGFHFGRPQVEPATPLDTRRQLIRLWNGFRETTLPAIVDTRHSIAPYQNALGYSASLVESGLPLGVACRGFLDLPDAERCFLLDENGLQDGPNLTPRGQMDIADARFHPLRNSAGANWSRRFYFRRAMEHPGKVQVSRPYLSVTGASPCITLSISLRRDGRVEVLCGDLTWSDHRSVTP